MGGREQALGDRVAQGFNAFAGRTRDPQKRIAVLRSLRFHCPNALGVLAGVNLTRHDDHWLIEKMRTELRELVQDHVEIVRRVAAAEIGNIYQMHEHTRALNVAEELSSQSVAVVRAFDQPGHIGHHECSVVSGLHYAQIRNQGSKRIIRNLRFGRGKPGDQGGFTGIRETHQANVSEQLQRETDSREFAGLPFFVFGGSLVCGRGEPSVTPAAASAVRCNPALSRSGEIEQQLSGFGVMHFGSDGHRQLNSSAIAACAVAAFAVPTALRSVLGIEPEMQQRIVVLARNERDIAAVAAVTAARATARHELLAPEGQATVSAVARLQRNYYFINEHRMRDAAGASMRAN